MQLARVPLASGEYEYDGHAVHAEAPASEYFPASHTEHVPPLLPEYPALHEQELTEVLPCGESALFGH